jgi:hypothetical protein
LLATTADGGTTRCGTISKDLNLFIIRPSHREISIITACSEIYVYFVLHLILYTFRCFAYISLFIQTTTHQLHIFVLYSPTCFGWHSLPSSGSHLLRLTQYAACHWMVKYILHQHLTIICQQAIWCAQWIFQVHARILKYSK